MKNLISKLLIVLALTGCAMAQRVILSWPAVTAPTCGPITAYNVYRSATSGGQVLATSTVAGSKIGSVQQVGTAPPATTFTDATMTFGQTGFYKVTSWAQGCSTAPNKPESVFSNELRVQIPAQVIIIQPAPPVLAPSAQVLIP